MHNWKDFQDHHNDLFEGFVALFPKAVFVVLLHVEMIDKGLISFE